LTFTDDSRGRDWSGYSLSACLASASWSTWCWSPEWSRTPIC